jgi:hypothetical protein
MSAELFGGEEEILFIKKSPLAKVASTSKKKKLKKKS